MTKHKKNAYFCILERNRKKHKNLTKYQLNNKKKTRLFFFLDTLIVILSFSIVAWYKPATKTFVIPHYGLAFLVFLGLWIICSTFTGKYNFQGMTHLSQKLKCLFLSNTIVLATGLTLLTLLEITNFSRLMVFGTFGLATLLEIIVIPPIIAFQKATRSYFPENRLRGRKAILKDEKKTKRIKKEFSKSLKEGIISISNKKVYDFIEKHISTHEDDIYFTATRRAFNIENKSGHHKAIINLQLINGVPNINQLFKATNQALPQKGLFFSLAETIQTRKHRILSKTFPPINYIIYIFDYLYHRVFSKIYPTRMIYNWVGHSNRAISRAELLGRLYAAGFIIIEERYINDQFVFIAQKEKEPIKLDYETIGGLIKLKRLGKDGKEIGVYKFRTMHPYSEFIQEYIYQKNDLQAGGKFKDDFRVNTLGKYLRKMWIDELPMFINVFKGEMKIVGVRPLSPHYFSLYTKELQDLRTTTKPGLLPPFYADTPVTLEEIMASEMRYLTAYKKHPMQTDIKYFFKILYNILIKRRRSQ